jgi:hypothetical protein
MFLKVLKNNRVRSPIRAMNLLRAVNFLVRRSTSFIVCKGVRFNMVSIFYGFSSTPLKLAKKPRNVSPLMAKTHLEGLSFI